MKLSEIYPNGNTFYVVAYGTGYVDGEIELVNETFARPEQATEWLNKNGKKFIAPFIVEAKIVKEVK